MKPFSLFQLFPLLLVVGCGGAPFEAVAASSDSGRAVEASSSNEAGEPNEAGGPSNETSSQVEAGDPQEAAGDAGSDVRSEGDSDQIPEAANDAADVTETSEASPEAATPECTTSRCVDGTTVQSCNAGTWGLASKCPYVCVAGVCSGSCSPGATQNCSECANFGTQTCLPTGTWGQCSASC